MAAPSLAVFAARTVRDRAVIAVVAALAFDVVARVVGFADCTGVLDERYKTLICPARWASGIWFGIHLAFLGYALAARRPSQRAVGGHDHLARLVIGISVLRPLWMIALGLDLVGVGLVVAIGLVVLGVAAFVGAHDLCRRERAPRTWTVPFALFLGWILVAASAHFAAWLVAFGWRGAGSEGAWTITMVVTLAVAGIGIGLRFADPIVPIVIAWACAGILAAQRAHHLPIAIVAETALLAAVLGALAALARAAMRPDRPPARLPSSARVA